MCFRKKKVAPKSQYDKMDKEYLELFKKEQEMERARIAEEVKRLNEEYRAKQIIEEELRKEEEEIQQAILLSPSVFDYKKVDGGYSVTLNDKKLLKLKLKRLIVPDNYKGVPVVNIDKMGVNSYDYIKHVTIPKSIVSVNEGAFTWSEGLESVHYLGTIDEWAQIEFGDGSANPLRRHGYLYVDGERVNWARLKTATKISNYAFINGFMAGITMPNGLTSIGDGAFKFFKGRVDLPATVTSIGEETFSYATIDTSVYKKSLSLPEKLKYIGANAFKGAELKEVYFFDRYNWWIKDKSGKNEIKLNSGDLANPATAAKYLTETYANKIWFKQ